MGNNEDTFTPLEGREEKEQKHFTVENELKETHFDDFDPEEMSKRNFTQILGFKTQTITYKNKAILCLITRKGKYVPIILSDLVSYEVLLNS